MSVIEKKATGLPNTCDLQLQVKMPPGFTWTVVEPYITQAVSILSDKYSFDKNEAMSELLVTFQPDSHDTIGNVTNVDVFNSNNHYINTNITTKSIVKTQKIEKTCPPAIPLPFCGVIEDTWCRGIRLNHGLHTQCTQGPIGTEGLCKTCTGQALKNKGVPTYGRIEQRLAQYEQNSDVNSWRDPNGKIVTPYTKVISKMGITREQAVAEADKLGWIIPEEHFVTIERSVGRPKKSTVVSDTESDTSEIIQPKKRGRPRKEKTVVESNVECDLISQLLSQAEKVSDNNDDTDQKIDKKPVPNRRRKSIKNNITIVPAQEPEPEQEPESEPEQEPESEPETEIHSDAFNGDLYDDDVEEVNVVRVLCGGSWYLKGSDNLLYDVETELEVGKYVEDGCGVGKIEKLGSSWDFE